MAQIRSTWLLIAPLILGLGSLDTANASLNCDATQAYNGPKLLSAFSLDDTPAVKVETDQNVRETFAAVLDRAFIDAIKLSKATAASISIYSDEVGYWSASVGDPEGQENLYWQPGLAKIVTASIIFQLIEEKQLLLEDTIDRWVPEIPNANIISVAQLLQHTNGLSNVTRLNGDQFTSSEILLNQMAQSPIEFCPGTNWSYNESGYVILSIIASKLDNKSWPRVIKDRISVPLNLGSLQVMEPNNKADNLITSSAVNRQTFVNEVASQHGAGALIASTKDAILFIQAYLRGDVFGSNYLRDISTEWFPVFTDIMGYGKGIMITRVPDPTRPTIWIGHAGGSALGKSLVIYDIQRRTYVSIALNSQFQAEAIVNTLLKIYDQYIESVKTG